MGRRAALEQLISESLQVAVSHHCDDYRSHQGVKFKHRGSVSHYSGIWIVIIGGRGEGDRPLIKTECGYFFGHCMFLSPANYVVRQFYNLFFLTTRRPANRF